MALHKSGDLGELNHNHLTTFGRKVMKKHLKIIGPFESILSRIKLFILSGIIAFNYNCEDDLRQKIILVIYYLYQARVTLAKIMDLFLYLIRMKKFKSF